MKKIFLLLFLFASFTGFSQEDAWVYFKDKPNATAMIASPLSILSQRALDRRVAQGIALDATDVPIHQDYINAVIAFNGITVKAKSRWLNCLHVRGSQTDISALKSLLFVAKVDFADKSLNNLVGKKSPELKSKSVSKLMDAAVTFNYGNSFNQIQMLNGHLLHQANYTGVGKIIAVLDTGFPQVNTALAFQRLRTNNQILGSYNFVTKSTSVYEGNSHGTSVLGFMGGFVDGQLVGTAPDAKYYLFTTEDVDSENPVEESNWVEAAEEADRVGADIITSSLGYFDYDNGAYSHTYEDMTGDFAFASRGANIAFNKGIVVLASAGNSGQRADPHIAVPAEAKNVIAVGAVQANRNYVAFSSVGPSFDGRVKPDVTAQGLQPFTFANGSINNEGSGTSYSCPIVAGMVACLWQAFPNKTALQIKELIVQSSDNFSEPAIRPRAQYGYGIPDFNRALTNGLSVNNFSRTAVLLFPNPTDDIISVGLPNNLKSAKIFIYSLLGQKVFEKDISVQAATISLKSLNSGTYCYKFEAKDFVKIGKIIKR